MQDVKGPCVRCGLEAEGTEEGFVQRADGSSPARRGGGGHMLLPGARRLWAPHLS